MSRNNQWELPKLSIIIVYFDATRNAYKLIFDDIQNERRQSFDHFFNLAQRRHHRFEPTDMIISFFRGDQEVGAFNVNVVIGNYIKNFLCAWETHSGPVPIPSPDILDPNQRFLNEIFAFSQELNSLPRGWKSTSFR